jgi:tetratricopeptide (TPR) repeat protein
MNLKPFEIPESYQSYLTKFESDPKDAISKLEAHIEKRNTGAVGYFFLAWLFLKNEQKQEALDAALQAKIRAPGSDFFERLHYYISHPRAFEAWQPTSAKKAIANEIEGETSHPIHNLDSLINKLSDVESKRIKLKENQEDDQDLSEKSSDVDDIVTETLAVIHEKQNNYLAAISTYRRLIESHPKRKKHYEKEIERIERLKSKKSDDSDSV